MGSSVLDHSGCGEGMKRCYTNMRMEDLCLRHSSLPSMTFPPCRTFMTPPCPLDTAVWLLTTSKFFHLCQYSFKHPGISHWTLLPETPSSTWKKKKKRTYSSFQTLGKHFHTPSCLYPSSSGLIPVFYAFKSSCLLFLCEQLVSHWIQHSNSWSFRKRLSCGHWSRHCYTPEPGCRLSRAVMMAQLVSPPHSGSSKSAGMFLIYLCIEQFS